MKHHHRAYDIWQTAKVGYDNFGWIFLIATLSTVIAASLKITAGAATIVIAFAFFYLAGRLHHKVDRSMRQAKRKRRK